jgi:hypothetical protein
MRLLGDYGPCGKLIPPKIFEAIRPPMRFIIPTLGPSALGKDQKRLASGLETRPEAGFLLR